MMEVIKGLIAAPVFVGDEEKNRLSKTLNGVLWLFIVCMLAGSLLTLLAAPQYRLTAGFTTIGLVVLGFLMQWLLRQGYLRSVALFFTFSLWAASTFIVVLMGGIESPETGAYVLAIMFAGLFLGIEWVYGFTILSIAAMLVIYFLQLNNLLPDVDLPLNALSGMIVNSFNVILASFFVAVVFRNLGQALRDLRSKQAEVAVRNTDLNNLMMEASENSRRARAEADEAQASLRAQLEESQVIARLSESLRGEQDISTLSKTVLRELCTALGAYMGAIFVWDGSLLRMTGSYAYSTRRSLSNTFSLGEGLVGQAAFEKQPIILSNLPPEYLGLTSGSLEFAPRSVAAIPFLNGLNVIGVIELACLNDFSESQLALMNKTLENISIAFSTALARTRINELLEQTQRQAQELIVREEDLKAVNKEVRAQAESLRLQQKELETANAELEGRANTLLQQRAILDLQNRELTDTQAELKRKAEELTLANKYKSEFLANMSHELRTPLNSLLILSRMFANNEDGNLTSDQVEAAQIIYNGGTDLLNLINDILDISRVEAGQMPFNFAPLELAGLGAAMRSTFEHMAEEKHLSFEIRLIDGLPGQIVTDAQRLGQIVKNFLSNAFKFTTEGGVKLVIEPSGEMVAFRVSDSGIGMTREQQSRIFEAFQQGDGSTSRKYGGTGLGLTISRELALRMGGSIELQSEPGRGSTFSLLMPAQPPAGESVMAATPDVQVVAPTGLQKLNPQTRASLPEPFLPDDRSAISKGERVVLIIEDDANFARTLLNYAHQKEFKALVSADGETGLHLAQVYHPDAILLDLKLPGMDGWAVLDALKYDQQLRQIPVHILSASEESLEAYKHGAIGFISKPISHQDMEKIFQRIHETQNHSLRSLLIVEDDANLRYSVSRLLGGSDVKISEAESGADAVRLMRAQLFDCAILDLTLPDMSGFELLSKIQQDGTIHKCPVIVYTGKALTEDENEQLLQYADRVIIKGVKSPERLLDETALFLHRVNSPAPLQKQDTINNSTEQISGFSGKHILVVDDDMRNAFALSRVLKDKDLKVSLARSGARALELLEGPEQVDLVLMDIMMPEMDGYEAMQRIRLQGRFKELPIIALTAKAMKGDQEKCIQAGANDYLSKPVDIERLLSLLRVWLYRHTL